MTTATGLTVVEARETLKVETYHMEGERLFGTATLSYWISPTTGQHTIACDEMPGFDGYSVVKLFDTVEEARSAWVAFRARLAGRRYVRAK